METRNNLLSQFVPQITALPPLHDLETTRTWEEPFTLRREGKLSIVYAPFGYLSDSATLAVIGITPSRQALVAAFDEARNALVEGARLEDVHRRVRIRASFAGPMRTNLIKMLDGLGAAHALGVVSTEVFFSRDIDVVHTTSLIRDAVFYEGKNYGGKTPALLRNAKLRQYLDGQLASELAALPEARIIPLGDRVTATLTHFIDRGVLDPKRCLLGFPHPSPGNGWRDRQYKERREDLLKHVIAW